MPELSPRFQVFVSSTLHDLERERSAVQDAILSLRHFPIGMELFPASDNSAWQIIESVIRESDYYVVVIGNRYGSIDESGLSYTEKEYDLAALLGKPVLSFLHASPDSLPKNMSDVEPTVCAKLEAFRDKLKKHHCKFWSNANELKEKVILSLVDAFTRTPMPGWIRNSGPPKTELLERLAELQNKYDELLDKYNKVEAAKSGVDSLVGSLNTLDSKITLQLHGKGGLTHELDVKLLDVFMAIGPLMAGPISETDVISCLWRAFIRDSIVKSYSGNKEGDEIIINGTITTVEIFRLGTVGLSAVSVPLLSCELITIHMTEGTQGKFISRKCWSLTPSGAKALHLLRSGT